MPHVPCSLTFADTTIPSCSQQYAHAQSQCLALSSSIPRSQRARMQRAKNQAADAPAESLRVGTRADLQHRLQPDSTLMLHKFSSLGAYRVVFSGARTGFFNRGIAHYYVRIKKCEHGPENTAIEAAKRSWAENLCNIRVKQAPFQSALVRQNDLPLAQWAHI